MVAFLHDDESDGRAVAGLQQRARLLDGSDLRTNRRAPSRSRGQDKRHTHAHTDRTRDSGYAADRGTAVIYLQADTLDAPRHL